MFKNFFLIDVRNISKHKVFTFLNGTIVGVLKNFHFKGADQAPMAFVLTDTRYLRVILKRLTPGKIPESLKAVGNIWKNIVPEYPLDYSHVYPFERIPFTCTSFDTNSNTSQLDNCFQSSEAICIQGRSEHLDFFENSRRCDSDCFINS